MTYQTIETLTVNGREFIISIGVRPCRKIGFYAHELGELTQWAKTFGGCERVAHRVNSSMKVKGRQFIPRPFDTIGVARGAVNEHANTHIIYA